MDYDLICSWLGLPPGEWPPDHYRLLGLAAGESRAELIEQRVHERLDTVRRYQMMHPEQATEAMNRLAQAFVCLTEAASKTAYDAQLGISASPAPPPQAETLDWLSSAPPVALPVEPASVGADKAGPAPMAVPSIPPPLPPAATLNYASTVPPPVRQPPPLPPVLGETEPPAAPEAVPVAPPVAPAPPSEPVDPVLEAAQTGRARRGIATKRTLYQRIVRTRQLIRLWTSLGQYISSPKRRLNRSQDGPELIRLLSQTAVALRGFPPLLGEAGQPGYLVLALTQVDTIKVFQSFSPHQREALSRDWRAGSKLLTAHRDFLRQQLRVMRKRPFRQRLLHATWSLIIDQPGTVLLLLALLALNVALWRTYAGALWDMLFSH
ncbi:MAG TPA: hypothetical protein VH682_32245 [Gemmataceae bacterium]|jgi:hypothetical protein